MPLSRLHSTTYALYPNEAHTEIRRVFTPYHAPKTKRHFCGFCGTLLTHWSEESPQEAEWISVNLGSLRSESLERLHDAGFLTASEDVSSEKTEEADFSLERTEHSAAVTQQFQGREVRGVPWFEEMVEGSDLGRIKRRRGGKTSADGRVQYEWEVVEIEGDEGENTMASTAKRKIDMMGDGDDVGMRSS